MADKGGDDTREGERLEAIAHRSTYGAGVNAEMVRASFRIFRRHLRGSSILELGPAEGIMTDLLAPLGLQLTVVEGAGPFCQAIRERHPEVDVHHSRFETFAPPATYDNIVLGHVLEHVQDPVGLLNRAAQWLAPDGRVLAAVPNSRSLHRQAAVLMGLLDFEEDLNEADLSHGHRRVYNPETLRRDFLHAGYCLEVFGGYWLKPVSNAQLEESWSPEMVDAFMHLGERYPDIAAENYVVAVRPSVGSEVCDQD